MPKKQPQKENAKPSESSSEVVITYTCTIFLETKQDRSREKQKRYSSHATEGFLFFSLYHRKTEMHGIHVFTVLFFLKSSESESSEAQRPTETERLRIEAKGLKKKVTLKNKEGSSNNRIMKVKACSTFAERWKRLH